MCSCCLEPCAEETFQVPEEPENINVLLLSSGQTTLVTRELRKLHKDLGRTVLGHQGLIKQKKGLRLIPKEDLARGHREGTAVGSEDGLPIFLGYLAAYLSSIYGHRTGVLIRMRVKEVREAVGDEERDYLINVMEHKTVRKFGTAQLYLEAEEYGAEETFQAPEEAEDINLLLLSRTMCRGDISGAGGG
ncbi:hypothetical protein D5F01_LYC24688 [Larimichthys crocea]|uniref:Uncharacterized protein n=1 Tax=Larimichthys crocea TaxID=215358 RepID=A0A6G0HEB7_LARCR|nr:hypothetical protein D5F01_LYC24688 [Larimichthys crocea]